MQTITHLRHCACLLHATQLARRGSQSLRDKTAALTHALQVSTLFLAAVMLRNGSLHVPSEPCSSKLDSEYMAYHTMPTM